ncbi:hypothetical protein KSX_80920 [Ktedonospora formicarum]|uniref:Uncharacterized protein n=1 Tax=Ktedonospora formicarum TaxID=2778364 RepID=A0A8J3IEU2_9CHLR|nr:hypothetical protein KSX_80920 [Ktedonospora formicarum]
MVDGVETRLNISLQKPVESRPFPSNFSQGCMATAAWAEAMTGFMEVGAMWAIIKTFKNGTDHFLHNFVAC